MVILDFSGVVVASVHVALSQLGNPSESDIRHLIMNSVRRLNVKFRKKYGEMVIAVDNPHYWRDGDFEFYKWKRREKRKETRVEDGVDWNAIYKTINKVKQELIDFFPYTVIEVDGCEADDIIGSLCKAYGSTQKILILSRDGDFKQLHNKNVHQYDPIGDKVIKVENPRLYLSEHIIRGDSGDGIPNIKSPNDSFYSGTKQKSIMKKWIADCIGEDPKEFCDTPEMLQRYYENERWIDLKKGVPEKLYNEVISCYNSGTQNTNNKIYSYLVNHRLGNMLDVMGDFHNATIQKETGVF